jgi:hypothetical protein
MPAFSTYYDIQKAIQVFNKQAYNAGFEFKVYSSEESCLYIQASFDFAYYVDVDIDQLFLLTEEELKEIVDFKEIEIDPGKPCFGIVFNIIGKDNYFINGTVICSSLYINWRRPEKNEVYV